MHCREVYSTLRQDYIVFGCNDHEVNSRNTSLTGPCSAFLNRVVVLWRKLSQVTYFFAG